MNQFTSKALLLILAAPLVALISAVEPAAAKINCVKLSDKPPIVNNPTHIQNVIWRNKRSHCQYEKLIKQQNSIPSAIEPSGKINP